MVSKTTYDNLQKYKEGLFVQIAPTKNLIRRRLPISPMVIRFLTLGIMFGKHCLEGMIDSRQDTIQLVKVNMIRL